MSSYDMDSRHLYVREHVEQLKRDYQESSPRKRRRRRLRLDVLRRELPSRSLRPSN